jgi:phosphate uptake regulator/aminoglycoside phosphotransferase (APT) family kinase protein
MATAVRPISAGSKTVQIPEVIIDNLRFLCAEVGSQVDTLQDYLALPGPQAARRITDRAGYSTNLMRRIHDSCIQRAGRNRPDSVQTTMLRAMEGIATHLEQIASLCRECVKQMQSVNDPEQIETGIYTPMLKRVRRGIDLVLPAIVDKDTRLAVKISQIEDRIDRDYKQLLNQYTEALKQSNKTEDLIHALFAAHSIEQMGDGLLGISESILSASLGQPVDIDRYHSLQDSIASLESAVDGASLKVATVAETRSGSRISGIGAAPGEDDFVAIFKDGEKRKLKEERDGVANWHEIYPGLAPRILAYKKRGRSAALLIEHLSGQTIEQILLNEDPDVLQEALDQLDSTLRSVWRETRTDEPVAANFMRQLQSRIGDVYAIHPEFGQSRRRVCGVEVPSLESLIDAARRREGDLSAPFAVYIHGDFNLDNIIYDRVDRRINFVDLHRSRYLDYVQDVSVFMVSNYRLQVFDGAQRRRIMRLALDFYQRTKAFAEEVGDETFDTRLALGLARSFITSTRFILDKSLARRMLLRARFLIEQVLDTEPAQSARYRLPAKEIFVG